MEETSPTDLEGAQAEREESEKQKQAQREREIADFRWLMEDARGRRFVWRLMREGRVFQDSGSNDSLELARQAGERRQGLKLVNEVLALCPEKWFEMIRDHRKING